MSTGEDAVMEFHGMRDRPACHHGLTIRGLIAEAHTTAREKGWHDPDIDQRTFGEEIALFHSELSEALEAYRDGDDMTRITHPPTAEGDRSPSKPEGVAVELADTLIRIFDTCGARGIPLEDALRQKMAYNKTRPHRHGGKRI